MKDKIKKASSIEELQALYTETFGKNGTMTAKLKTMATLSNDERSVINAENAELRQLFKDKQTELENAALNAKLATEYVDVTLDKEPEHRGTLHPLTQSLKELSAIMESFGFTLWTGPEIEDDWHNFTALNTPEYHPARDMQDTFFLENGNVMRTQTSAIQIRAMEQHGAPIKIFAIGSTYRKEWDATHAPMFGQMEALYIDKNVTMSDLIGTMRALLSKFFEKDIEIRIVLFYYINPQFSIKMRRKKK